MSDQEATQTIERELAFIVDFVRARVPGLRSILLGGGFGRGEGGVWHHGDRCIPINDYDVYLIADERLDQENVRAVFADCTRRLLSQVRGRPRRPARDPEECYFDFERQFFVDGHPLTARQMGRVPPLIRYWEMRRNSRVLWGEDTRSLFRDFDQKDIPLGEGVRFVCNQLTTLVRMWRKSDIEPMLYFLYRTWTSFGTALLLAVRKLEPTYRDRSVRLAETFRQDYPELAADLPHFPEQLTRATEFKIAPQFRGDTSLDEVNALWRCTRDAAWKVLEAYLNRWLGRAPLTDNLRRLSGHYYRDYIRQPFPLNVALDLAARLFMNWRYYRRTQRECGRGYFRWTWRSVDIQLWSVLPAVLDGLPGGKFTPETLAQIPYPALGLSPCWKEVRERYVRAFDGVKVLREPPSALGFLFGK